LLLIDRTHEGSVGWDRIAAEQKEGFFGRQLDAFANDIVKLSHGQIRRYQVLFLVNVGNVRAIRLFANNGDAVGILGPDALRFGLALFCVGGSFRRIPRVREKKSAMK